MRKLCCIKYSVYRDTSCSINFASLYIGIKALTVGNFTVKLSYIDIPSQVRHSYIRLTFLNKCDIPSKVWIVNFVNWPPFGHFYLLCFHTETCIFPFEKPVVLIFCILLILSWVHKSVDQMLLLQERRCISKF